MNLPIEPSEALLPKERRKSDRKKLIVDVQLEDSEVTGVANTRDIGIGGLYLVTGASLEMGSHIDMQMMLAGEEFSVQGIVTYVDPGQGAGIRFNALSEKQEAILKKELEMN